MNFAFINDNKIIKIEEFDSQDLITDSHLFQQVILIDGMLPMPKVGWVFDNGQLFADIPNVTPRQIRQALILSGVNLSDIDMAIGMLPEPNKSLAMAEWEYSTLFIRRNPLVNSIGALLGWTPEEIDDLFLMAVKL